jgi:glutaminyl-peptide cyclotransferase
MNIEGFGLKFRTRRTFVPIVTLVVLCALSGVACTSTKTMTEVSPTISMESPSRTVGVPKATKTQEPVEITATEITQPRIEFDGQRAFELVERQLEFGYRIPGSDGHRMTGDWILEQLQASGWSTEEQNFSYQSLQGRNIIAKAGPEGGEWVIFGAHYDTRPIADRDENNPSEPVLGANDGASGVAVLLELARVIQPEDLDRPLWLVFFDLEDSGGIDDKEWIVGSNYFAEHLEDKPSQVIIVDMVGDADLQLYYELNSNVELRAEIWQLAADLGFTSFIPETKHSMIDDHTSFLRRGIPAIDIIDFDYPYWHTTEDTLDKVSASSLEQVGQTLEVWLLQD